MATNPFGSMILCALSRLHDSPRAFNSIATRRAVDARRRYLESWKSILNLAVGRHSQRHPSTGSSRYGEPAARHKDEQFQTSLCASSKSLCRLLLLLLAENSQRLF